MKYLFAADKKPPARKSYEARTGMTTRANVTMAAAAMFKPERYEDDNGNMIRVWRKEDMQRYTHSDIASTLINRVAVEPAEMLGTVPPPAIKYAITNGWLVPNESKTLYRITLKAAIDLDLPLHFRGKNNGRKIPFAAAPSSVAKKA